ncbi:MAG TPA: 5-(carboxyamino)imidazole ribonucleotide mutase [bacterium]|nr:5-(carboxyamino)imidazole ribonucleotide mutase [bacterium]
MAKDRARVLVIVGSKSDLEIMNQCAGVLEDFGVPYELTVASAHRSPQRARRLAEGAAAAGIKVIIAAAGMAAHLAGVVAAHTHLPVIGVPLQAGDLAGLDALLSTVQMPPGVPVAAMAVGSAGAANAAHLAVRILALSDAALARRVKSHRRKMVRDVEAAARTLTKK